MKKVTTEDFIFRAKQVHGEKFNYSKSKYILATKKLIIICPIHGEFLQSPHHHLEGYSCSKCGFNKLSIDRRSHTKEFIKKAKKIHKNEFDYSLTKYGINQNDKIKIICKKHGIFFQRPDNHLSGYGCSKCALKQRSDIFRSNTNQFINKSDKIHNNQYNYSKVNYINAHTKVEIICPKHGSFLQKPNNHLSGKGCIRCTHSSSKPENEFLDILKIDNRQVRIKNFKLDGIKNNKIFEFLGDYYHGNPQKYNMIEINEKSKKTFGYLYNKTIEKFNKLNTLGYSIYYMWENDWNLWKRKKIRTFPIKKYNNIKI